MANIANWDVSSITGSTGSNLRFTQETSWLDLWRCSAMQLKEAFKQKEQVTVLMEDMWRVKYLATLLSQRQELHYIGATEQRNRLCEHPVYKKVSRHQVCT